jgi:hypothetical protein
MSNRNTQTPHQLNENLIHEAITMQEILGKLEDLIYSRNDFFETTESAFLSFMKHNPSKAAQGFEAFLKISELIRVVSLHDELINRKASEYRETENTTEALSKTIN